MGTSVDKEELIAFEREVVNLFEAGKIKTPVHLSGGNEDALIRYFKRSVVRDDWIFSTWRNHYHALLQGVPPEKIIRVLTGGGIGMNMSFPEHRFYSSAIVSGMVPIALGVAAGVNIRRTAGVQVHCFVGDMAARTGIFHEAVQYAQGHLLPIRFIVEDNGLSTNTPTREAWGGGESFSPFRYSYARTYPHVNTGKFVSFF